jgi:hypothetical protein
LFGDALVTPRWRLLSLFVLVGGCRPAVTPLPAPTPVPAPIVRPVDAEVPTRITLALRHASARYTVRSRSELTQDSAGTPITEQVESTAFVQFALERTGDPTARVPLGLRGTGRVEGFVLTPTTRLANARTSALSSVAEPPSYPTLPLTVTFEAMVDGTITRVAPTPSLANECDRPETGATAMARELLVRLPGALAAGSAWADTARVFVCRGGVPVTVQTIATNRVTAIEGSNDGPATRVRVVRELRIRAEGEQATTWRTVAVSGRGQGRQELVLSAPAGVLQELESDSETVFDVRDTARPNDGKQRITQRVHYVASLVRP